MAFRHASNPAWGPAFPAFRKSLSFRPTGDHRGIPLRGKAMPFMNHVLTRAPAQFASQLVSRLASQLGRCPRCMRSCLAVAVTMWMVWLVASITVSRPEIPFGIAILAFALTGLWMAHLSAFGFRIALTQMGDQPRAGAACQATSPRREFVASLAKSMALAVVTTALPVRSWAQQPCEKCERFSGKQRTDCCDCAFSKCLAACKGPNPPIRGSRVGDCERGCGSLYFACKS